MFLLTRKCPVSIQDRVNLCSSCEEGMDMAKAVILYHLTSVAGARSKRLSGFHGEGQFFNQESVVWWGRAGRYLPGLSV